MMPATPMKTALAKQPHAINLHDQAGVAKPTSWTPVGTPNCLFFRRCPPCLKNDLMDGRKSGLLPRKQALPPVLLKLPHGWTENRPFRPNPDERKLTWKKR